MFILAIGVLLFAGLLIKMSVIFWPISLAITMFVVKYLKHHYYPQFCGKPKGGKNDNMQRNIDNNSVNE